jgi:hypothetical protein
MSPEASTRSSERGAVLIHVAIGLIVLIAFSAFVVDYGVLWVSRGQAQNSADAGALAGAVALAYDVPPLGGNKNDIAKVVAEQVAEEHAVWSEAPGAVVQSPYGGVPPCAGAPETCVRVDSYRTGAAGSGGSAAIPTWFARLVGVDQQGVRAMAVARAAVGNATDCLKPWAVVDKWQERWPITAEWTPESVYDKYINSGSNKGAVDPAKDPPDYYEAPTTSSTGTGFHPFNPDGSYTSDYGRQISLKLGDQNDFAYGSGWFMALALGDNTGGDDYRDSIKGCVGFTYAIGQEVPVSTEPGNKVGPTRDSVGGADIHTQDADSIFNQDPGAYWNQSLNGGRGGVAGSAFPVSPRIVAVPLVNPDQIAQAQVNGRDTVTISNIMGFFVEGMTPDKKGVLGRLITMPGLKTVGTSPIGLGSAFLFNISLVR